MCACWASTASQRPWELCVLRPEHEEIYHTLTTSKDIIAINDWERALEDPWYDDDHQPTSLIITHLLRANMIDEHTYLPPDMWFFYSDICDPTSAMSYVRKMKRHLDLDKQPYFHMIADWLSYWSRKGASFYISN